MSELTVALLPKNYQVARAEAIRFLEKMDELEHLLSTDERQRKYWGIIGCPESAAVKRSSMDLTRALAKLRKGGLL